MSARATVALLPAEPGVYRFRDSAGKTLYIGRAVDLRRRVGSYWGALRDRPRLRRMVPQIVRIEALACASEHEAAWLERNLLEAAKPRWNRTRGGQEVAVYLRLHSGDRAARLDLVHEASTVGRHFGPFLGGDKVRLALSGLTRVAPLAYAGGELTGSAADFARVRGIDPDTRDDLVALVTAALERDPLATATVLGTLADRRDRATAALAFELAGRIQAEATALAWILAEQKVTRPTPVDHPVHGFADGVLVSCDVRAGRLDRWSERDCDEATGQARAGLTPPSWRSFAEANARLAARLRGRT